MGCSSGDAPPCGGMRRRARSVLPRSRLGGRKDVRAPLDARRTVVIRSEITIQPNSRGPSDRDRMGERVCIPWPWILDPRACDAYRFTRNPDLI
jgi:hypothetical protein